MSQRRLDTFFKLKSDKDKGDRDINVSEGLSSVASASAISKHGPLVY